MTTTTTQPTAILRVTKLRTWSTIAASGGHTWRTLSVPHADLERRHLNEDWRPVESPEALRMAVESRLATVTASPTRGAVLVLEYLITARRAAFTEHGGETDAATYFRDAVAFLEERHGTANLVAVNVQHDETAPHLVAYVVPLVERPARTVRRSVFAPGRDAAGRQRREVREFETPAGVFLSADHYNGTPAKLSALQSEFAARVASRHGLTRGLEMSAATHTTNKAHHAAIARAMVDHVGLSPKDLERRGRLWNRESLEEHARRLSEEIRAHYAPTVARAATAEHDRRRARDMIETARRHRARYHQEHQDHAVTRAQLEHLTAGLGPEQRQSLEGQAAEYRKANHRALRERKLADRSREETARREAEERLAREEQRRQHKEEARREMVRARDDAMVDRLRDITPDAFARLGEAWRLLGWRLMRERDELEAVFERVDASGLVEPSGYLSAKGRALVERGCRQMEATAAASDSSHTGKAHATHTEEVWVRKPQIGPGL